LDAIDAGILKHAVCGLGAGEAGERRLGGIFPVNALDPHGSPQREEHGSGKEKEWN